MTVGEKIKSYRLKRGLTQKELASLCSIDKTKLHRIETNLYSPRLEVLRKLSNALAVPIDEFLEEDLC